MAEVIIVLLVLSLFNVATLIANACVLHAAVKLYSENQKQAMIRQLKKEQPEKEQPEKEPEPQGSWNSLEERMRYCDAVGRHEDARAYALVLKNLKGG